MNYNFYERNNTKYDSIREYCSCERLNEEYMRTLMEKPNHCSSIKVALIKIIRKIYKKNSRSIKSNPDISIG